MAREFGPNDYNANYYGHDGVSSSSNYKNPYNNPGIKDSIRHSLWALHVYSELRSKMPLKTIRILDVGGATGLFLQYLNKYPGIDPFVSDFSVWATENTVPALSGRSTQADARALPYQSESFDGLVCLDVLEHIPRKDMEDTVSEMHRVLRVGGRAVLIVNVGNTYFESDESHVTKESRQWWTQKIREAGFNISNSIIGAFARLPIKQEILTENLSFLNPGLIIADKT